MSKEMSLRTVLAKKKWTDHELVELWYDWFCKQESLPGKSRKLLGKLRAIADSPRIDQDKNYVFFKNNCPMNGTLYDDFRICDIKSEDVIFCVTPSSGHNVVRGEASVWGKNLNGEFGELVTGNWKDVKAFFRMTDQEWSQRQAAIPPSPFQVGVAVHVKGEYVPFGEMPKKHFIEHVNDLGGAFRLDNGHLWFKKDGTLITNRRGDRMLVCELWSEYEASQFEQDQINSRRMQQDKLRDGINAALRRIPNDGSQQSFDWLKKIYDAILAVHDKINLAA